MSFELALMLCQGFWPAIIGSEIPVSFNKARRRVEMDCATMRLPGNAPAMRNSHRHQKRVPRFRTHALAADFRDEFTGHDVNPLVLLVMCMQGAP